MKGSTTCLYTTALLLAAAGRASGQQAEALTPLAVGETAPDFGLVSATRSGVGDTVHLSDFKGKTVVLAFFFKIRTKG